MSSSTGIGKPARKPALWGTFIALLLLTGLVAASSAAAAKSGAAPEAARVSTASQIKKLKKTIASLTRRIATLEAQPQPTIPKIPTTLPPSGPAGGDLIGQYPNPLIGANAIGTAEIADGAVGSTDIGSSAVATQNLAVDSVTSSRVADGTLTEDDLATGSVAGSELAGGIVNSAHLRPYYVRSHSSTVGFFGSAVPTVKEEAVCSAGDRLITGGYEWADESQTNMVITRSGPSLDAATLGRAWIVRARLRVGEGTANTLAAVAYCLPS